MTDKLQIRGAVLPCNSSYICTVKIMKIGMPKILNIIPHKIQFHFLGVPAVSKFKRVSLPDVDITPAQYSFIKDQSVFKTDDTTLRYVFILKKKIVDFANTCSLDSDE